MNLKQVFEKVKQLSEVSTKTSEHAKKVASSKTAKLKDLKREVLALSRIVDVLNQTVRAIMFDSIKITEVIVAKETELKTALQEKQQLKDVLNFYASQENWQLLDGKKSTVELDGGQRARLALKNADTPNE